MKLQLAPHVYQDTMLIEQSRTQDQIQTNFGFDANAMLLYSEHYKLQDNTMLKGYSQACMEEVTAEDKREVDQQKLTPDQAEKLKGLFEKCGAPKYHEDGTLDKEWFIQGLSVCQRFNEIRLGNSKQKIADARREAVKANNMAKFEEVFRKSNEFEIQTGQFVQLHFFGVLAKVP